MVGWIILGVILLILIGILVLPVGVDLGYEDGKLHLAAKAAGILIPIFPRQKKPDAEPKRPKKPKAPKPPKEEKPKEDKSEKPKKTLEFTKEDILELVKKVIGGIGRFNRAWKVERFVFRYTAGGPDPYQVAKNFAFVNAALCSLAPVCAKRFRVKDLDVRTDVDFMRDYSHIDFGLAMTIRIGQMLGVGLGIAFGALGILLRSKRRSKKEGKAGKVNPEQTETPAQKAEDVTAADDSPAAQTTESQNETDDRQDEERT